ncbi:hypothetical protein KKD37_04610 [Patescibacteria group bacterium]|nr:hypothetical protein [Patescibacteria group bacterium]
MTAEVDKKIVVQVQKKERITFEMDDGDSLEIHALKGTSGELEVVRERIIQCSGPIRGVIFKGRFYVSEGEDNIVEPGDRVFHVSDEGKGLEIIEGRENGFRITRSNGDTTEYHSKNTVVLRGPAGVVLKARQNNK